MLMRVFGGGGGRIFFKKGNLAVRMIQTLRKSFCFVDAVGCKTAASGLVSGPHTTDKYVFAP